MHHFFLIAQATDLATKAVGGEASLTMQGAIVGLVGIIGWFVRSYLADIKTAIETSTNSQIAKMEEVRSEMKTARIAVDLNTRSVTMAVLAIATLIPGSKPILEEAKASADERLKKEGL